MKVGLIVGPILSVAIGIGFFAFGLSCLWTDRGWLSNLSWLKLVWPTPDKLMSFIVWSLLIVAVCSGIGAAMGIDLEQRRHYRQRDQTPWLGDKGLMNGLLGDRCDDGRATSDF